MRSARESHVLETQAYAGGSACRPLVPAQAHAAWASEKRVCSSVPCCNTLDAGVAAVLIGVMSWRVTMTRAAACRQGR